MDGILRELGFSDYEIKVYITLLQYETLKGKDISEKSRVPNGRTYNILEKLEKKGLISIIPVKPKTFKIIKPETALKNYIESKKDELVKQEEELMNRVKTIKKRVQPLNKIEESISITSGYSEMWNTIRDVIYRSEKEMLGIYTFDRKAPFSIHREEVNAMKRGVKIKILATSLENKQFIIEKMKMGEEVKYYPIEHFRITIIDKKEGVLTIVNPKDRDDRIIIHIKNKDFATALSDYFYLTWKKAEEISNLK